MACALCGRELQAERGKREAAFQRIKEEAKRAGFTIVAVWKEYAYHWAEPSSPDYNRPDIIEYMFVN